MSFSPPITWVRVSVPMKSVWPRMIRLMPFGNSPFQDLGDQGRRERTPDRNAYEKSAVSCSREAASSRSPQDFAIAMPDLRTRVVRTSCGCQNMQR